MEYLFAFIIVVVGSGLVGLVGPRMNRWYRERKNRG
jgi:hypothetical protein